MTPDPVESKGVGRAGFGSLLTETVRETIADVLGRSVSEAFENHLQIYAGIKLSELLTHSEVLFTTLKSCFGVGGQTLGRLIIRRLYQKTGVQFVEIFGRPMIDYVEDLKRELAEGKLT